MPKPRHERGSAENEKKTDVARLDESVEVESEPGGDIQNVHAPSSPAVECYLQGVIAADFHPNSTCGRCRFCYVRWGLRKGDRHLRDIGNSDTMSRRPTLLHRQCIRSMRPSDEKPERFRYRRIVSNMRHVPRVKERRPILEGLKRRRNGLSVARAETDAEWACTCRPLFPAIRKSQRLGG